MTITALAYQPINREAIWASCFAWLQSQLTAPAWTPSTPVAQGYIALDPMGHRQRAVTAGTTGVAAPAWNDAGGTTADGSGLTAFTWQDLGQGFTSMGRKHIAPPELSTADQPALFQVAGREIHIPQKPPGAPFKLVLRGFLIVYAFGPTVNENIGTEQLLGETQLNQLLFAIDKALVIDDIGSGKFTLGRTVTHCWIEGDTDLDPGIFGPQAAAILPLNILV
jgi:hypothetical protein